MKTRTSIKTLSLGSLLRVVGALGAGAAFVSCPLPVNAAFFSIHIGGLSHPPPPPRREMVPPRPGAHYVWVSGYWGEQDGHYVWIRGYWEHTHRGHTVWIAPRWVRHGHHWEMEKGHWR
ncbi:MAG: hypothetical protein ACREFX_07315 [Opitutaceae bacterium]